MVYGPLAEELNCNRAASFVDSSKLPKNLSKIVHDFKNILQKKLVYVFSQSISNAVFLDVATVAMTPERESKSVLVMSTYI